MSTAKRFIYFITISNIVIFSSSQNDDNSTYFKLVWFAFNVLWCWRQQWHAYSKSFKVLHEVKTPEEIAACDSPARVVLAISIFFLALTFTLYVTVKTLRKPSNRMTMALVFNLLITFILYLYRMNLEESQKNLGRISEDYEKNLKRVIKLEKV